MDQLRTTEGYYVEHNGDCWQSVFPSKEARQSALHTTVDDALTYMIEECGVPSFKINVLRAD
jgi:hypothetical protein